VFTALLGCLAVSVSWNPDVSAEQFARITATTRADFQDVSFLFEGRFRGLPPGTTVADVLGGLAPDGPSLGYQGSYKYRHDGATFLDVTSSHNFGVGATSLQQQFALLGNRLVEATHDLDTGGKLTNESGGGPGVLNQPKSPERILYLSFLKGMEEPASRNYKFLGWEDLDGHRCLKVQLDQSLGWPPGTARRDVVILWIDVERGGHPLRVDFADREGVRMRSTGIELTRIPAANGRELWFPVRGRTETFHLDGKQYGTRVVGIETYFIIDGTIKINQGVPDSQFQLNVASPKSGRNRATPTLNDREGMTKRLKAQLSKANAQAKELRASPSSEESWLGGLAPSIGLGVAGVAILALVVWMRVRRG